MTSFVSIYYLGPFYMETDISVIGEITRLNDIYGYSCDILNRSVSYRFGIVFI